MNISLYKNLSIAIIASGLLLSGCAYQPRPTTQPAPQRPAEPEQTPPKGTPLPSSQRPDVSQQGGEDKVKLARRPQDISNSAVMSLFHEADRQVSAGNMSQAAAALEQALDISPRNPFIYQRLSAVRLSQKQYAQAESLAMKANSLAHGNPYIIKNNWRLISAARHYMGDDNGQIEADHKVSEYKEKINEL